MIVRWLFGDRQNARAPKDRPATRVSWRWTQFRCDSFLNIAAINKKIFANHRASESGQSNLNLGWVDADRSEIVCALWSAD